MRFFQLLFLTCLAIFLLSAVRPEPPADPAAADAFYRVTKSGQLWVKAGYAVQSTYRGQTIVYNPRKYAVVGRKGRYSVVSLGKDELANLIRKVYKNPCGKGFVLINGRCYRQLSLTQVQNMRPCGDDCRGLCVNGVCLGTQTSEECSGNQIRINGECVDIPDNPPCPAGQVQVQGECVDIDAGQCNPACPEGQMCVNGECQPIGSCSPPCTFPEICINNNCEGPQCDCDQDEICVNGNCRPIPGDTTPEEVITIYHY